MRADVGLVLVQFSLALGAGSIVASLVGDPWSPCMLAACGAALTTGFALLRADRR
ncbi:hypothetical protein ITJ44_15350 [Clavibacter sp. VKM Ac-2873]|uniref:hypothetical protein n=1 Tax=Clavibacter sp. VKM Ac-2873 TaxID=2783813 RepID=UPI00188C30EB|nr:hypothetical protein [Clavibacter sp. VKM Ac-2873]MBF4619452.1 hypothetical protein [Clavibacter sp. VKM Ac-2873]